MTHTINAIVFPGGFNLPLRTAQKQGFFGDAVPGRSRTVRRESNGEMQNVPCGTGISDDYEIKKLVAARQAWAKGRVENQVGLVREPVHRGS